MAMQEQLIGLAQRSYAEIRRFAEKMSQAEKQKIGSVDHWSARDVIAHLVEEKKRIADRLAAVRFGEKIEVSPDFESVNRDTWEAYRDYTFDQILQVLDEKQEALLVHLESIVEGDFLENGRFEWLNGRPLWRFIAGIDFLHSLSHLIPLYIEKGDLDYANQLCQIEARLAGPLDDSPVWQSIINYNAACNFALMGDKLKSMKKLTTALRLSNHLVKWSQEDPDLVSLHGDAEFKALISSVSSAQK